MKTNDTIAMYKLILKEMNNDVTEKADDDMTFRADATKEISNRDKEYTKLLSHFVKITQWRNILKEIFKWTFYIAIIVSVIALICLMRSIVELYAEKCDMQQIMEAIPLFITSIVGFVSVIIAIPVAITKYLFSVKEDEYITQIILHTQDHDTTGREWVSNFEKIAKAIDVSDTQQEDEDIKSVLENIKK